jgi:hypothetical protein
MPDSLAADVERRAPAFGHRALKYRKERMATSPHNPDKQSRTVELLSAGAAAELDLLRSERKAEKVLAEALASLAGDEARLLRAQHRLERSRESVAAAKATLREVQARRADGPTRLQD